MEFFDLLLCTINNRDIQRSDISTLHYSLNLVRNIK